MFSYPLVVPGLAAAAAGPTLPDYYVPLAENLGSYLRLGVSSTVPSGEPGRWVLCDELGEDEDERQAYAGAWLYVRQGGQAGAQRRIRQEGYEGPPGALALTRTLPDNLRSGDVVEVTSPLPVRGNGLTRGLVDFVNGALDRIYIRARVPLEGNGTRSQSLGGYPWLIDQRQTDGLYDRRYLVGSDPTRRSAAEYAIVPDGASASLSTQVVYGQGEPFELAVLVKASHLTFDGSGWGYSQPYGLLNLTDQAAAPVAWVLPVAMALALDSLITRTQADTRTFRGNPDASALADAERARLAADYTRRLETRWGHAAKQIIAEHAPRPDPDPPRRAVAVTGRLERHRLPHWHA